MSEISLTASMRSNLLSLQNIARQQDIVQNRLATGLKVSSAIDNPSSYYTASSLNNRAADLTALLDAMSQGIQTIKAASEAIDSGTKFLEQAKAVANQALETAIPAKEWFAEQAGENGAVVETAQELLDAINAGKETIVVYGKIEMTDQTVTLKQGQKLVGTEYFTGLSVRNSDGSRFSQLIIEDKRNLASSGIEMAEASLAADLNISYTHSFLDVNGGIRSKGVSAVLRNIDVDHNIHENHTTLNNSSAIVAAYGGKITLEGEININSRSFAIYAETNGYIKSTADINIISKRDSGYAVYLNTNGKFEASGSLNAGNSSGILLYDNSIFTNIGKFDYIVQRGACFLTNYASSTINLNDGFCVYTSQKYLFQTQTDVPVHINIAAGVVFNIIDTGRWTAVEDVSFDASKVFSITDFDAMAECRKEAASSLPKETEGSEQYGVTGERQYNTILQQYDFLLQDSSYKGINLLLGQNLKINFNEDRSSKIEVAGVKADSDSLGLKTKEWKTAEDIEKSVSELEEAINSLRSFASAFGNYYSIVTTRQDFTENLINVLEEGADKLTLADMNQESANMLALQTSQQLAVNSLSLASQASQSILKLF